jgi:hypothetical protein
VCTSKCDLCASDYRCMWHCIRVPTLTYQTTKKPTGLYQGYQFALCSLQPTGDVVIASQSHPPPPINIPVTKLIATGTPAPTNPVRSALVTRCVTALVTIPNNRWLLIVSPGGGWVPPDIVSERFES